MKKLSLSALEASAIIGALHLVPWLDFNTSDIQLSINCALAESAMEKLSAGRAVFAPDEIRVMFGAVQAAHFILTGSLPLDDPELRSKISPHFFVYGSLLNRRDFQPQL